MDSVDARPLPGTEGVAGIPFWSPDSRYLAFMSSGKLQKIDVSGGPTQTLCNVSNAILSGAWNPDGRIIFGINAPGQLQEVRSAGGAVTPVATSADSDAGHGFPSFLPDGRHFVYAGFSSGGRGGIYLGALDAKPGEAALKKLLSDASQVAFAASPDGNVYLLFRRNTTLMAQPFDLKRLDLAGEAVPVGEQVASFAAAQTGTLVYRTGASVNYHLSWFDRQGKPLESIGDTDVLPTPAPALSPDGKRVAFSRADPQSANVDIWLYDLARGVPTRFTFDAAQDSAPVWSPDGSQIVFVRGPGAAGGDIYQKASDMSGSEQLLLKTGGLPVSWSRDGRFVLYQTTVNQKGVLDVMVLPMTGSAGERKPWPFANTDFSERGPRFSPDGRFVSYISDESGKSEVYVRPFDPSVTGGSAAGGPKWQISKDGGDGAHWRADGKEIIYMSPTGTLMSVDVTTAPVFQAGVPKPLFKSAAVAQFWDLTPDAKRLLVPVPSGAAQSAPYRVTLNWTAMLRRP